ncbi:DUF3515 domain-containing protein [Streptomyces hoynatensis]|uniref:DUF3515 domain-containing protein n=1 Tax=Streptomyces hoynatensis TaxID=1141874 RepID=A0A3A9YS61_9ACTN|nr:DUF3515 domain-containing protein [Streptomyces hoynatensis]RKN38815.1 DUF3515 domain-containing protein [Streptomyces hoynatensis]
MTFTVRRSLTLLSAGLFLAACSAASGAPRVTVPTPEGAAAEACRALAGALPDRVADRGRAELDEDSPYVAAWGDPAIVLRCGVPRPERLTPGSETYDPASDAVAVNDVSWLLEEQSDGIRFTTTERRVFVEVTVPDDYAPEVNPLLDLAAAVDAHIPLDELYAQAERDEQQQEQQEGQEPPEG